MEAQSSGTARTKIPRKPRPVRMRVACLVLIALFAVVASVEVDKSGAKEQKGVLEEVKSFSATLKGVFAEIKKAKAKLGFKWGFLGKAHDAGMFEFKMPKRFQNKTMSEIVRFVNGELSVKKHKVTVEKATPPAEDEDEPPESYNFFESYPTCARTKSVDQVDCGACWAFTSTTMIAHRVCRRLEELKKEDPDLEPLPEEWRLSAQSICSCCNRRTCPNGCCTGGAVEYALDQIDDDTPIYSRDCAKFDSWSGDDKPDLCDEFKEKCAAEEAGVFKKRVRTQVEKMTFSVNDVKLLSGEEAMKKAVWKHGPICVSIKTKESFLGYSGKGVYAGGESADLGDGKLHNYHGLVLVGWGTETIKKKPVKYWLLENSWGDEYDMMPKHQKHLLKILRGSDEMEIESRDSHSAVPTIRVDGKEISLKEGWPKKAE